MAERLLVFWQQQSGRVSRPGTKSHQQRLAKINARLKTLGPRVIATAIKFVCNSDFHRERGHTDITLICRSDEQTEGYAHKFGLGKPSTPKTANDQRMDWFTRKAAEINAGKYAGHNPRQERTGSPRRLI